MKFENIKVYNFEDAFRGMRNPKESWERSDSSFGISHSEYGEDDSDLSTTERWILNQKNFNFNETTLSFVHDTEENYKHYQNVFCDICFWLRKNGILNKSNKFYNYAYIGPADMKLAQTLIKGGSEHRKFLRQIMVSVDITAPLYFFKEFDTYKIGTVANSTSTMHKITSKPITLDCFEIGDYDESVFAANNIIPLLEDLRQKYLETKDNRYWKELIRWLPESWLQTRTVTMNYENLLNMCSTGQRRFHKLTEWSKDFIDFARSLPYAQDLIFLDEVEKTIFEKLKKI